MNRIWFLNQAKDIITTDRNQRYGEPENNFHIIAALWKEATGREIEDWEVPIMMTLFKIGRIMSGMKSTGKPQEDSFVDAIGYLACAGELLTNQDTKEDEIFNER